MLSGCLEADYRPIMAIHHKLRRENMHIYDELAADKFFSIRMIGVENSQRGMGVATELIRRSGNRLFVSDRNLRSHDVTMSVRPSVSKCSFFIFLA